MIKKLLVLTMLFGFCACNVWAVDIFSSWVGDDGGLWDQASNWNPGIVPDNSGGNNFYVTISPAGSNSIRFTQDRTVSRITCYGEVDLEIGERTLSLLDPNGLINHGIFEATGSGVEHEINGNILNTEGAIIEVSYWFQHQGKFVNNGQLMVIPGGNASIEDGNLINNGTVWLYDGTASADGLENSDSGIISGFGSLYGGQVIQNAGSIRAFGGPLTIAYDLSLNNSGSLVNEPGTALQIGPVGSPEDVNDINNHGTIEVNAGGSVVFDADVVNEPDGFIELNGGTFGARTITQSAGAEFEGLGTITGDVVIEPNSVVGPVSIIRLTGPTNVFGNVTIGAGATFEVSDGTTIITGHTTCNNGTIHMIGGRVICQGGLTDNNCEIIWEPGIDSNAADYNLDGRVNLEDYAQFARTWLWEASWR
ncbi:MAG TPA: hypothetical protein HPP87_01790 [Planctomycetes bacterium]|nr:hypothetical protein [Planctomycetota bacterium]